MPSLLETLHEKSWDAPFFKVIGTNDSIARRGHQNGFVVLAELRPFLPLLDRSQATPEKPTVEHILLADFFSGSFYLGSNAVRYQLQTWRATRPGEARITKGTQRYLQGSRQGDYIILQRHLLNRDRIRIILIKQDTADFATISDLAGTRDSGPLHVRRIPILPEEIQSANEEMSEDAKKPFRILRPDQVDRRKVNRAQLVRTLAFRKEVKFQYRQKCAVSGISLVSSKELYEIEAVHVVPLGLGGPDDPRNGLALCRTLHWAFDRGLFGFNENLEVVVPDRALHNGANPYLRKLRDKSLSKPISDQFQVAQKALAWHRKNVLSLWS